MIENFLNLIKTSIRSAFFLNISEEKSVKEELWHVLPVFVFFLIIYIIADWVFISSPYEFYSYGLTQLVYVGATLIIGWFIIGSYYRSTNTATILAYTWSFIFFCSYLIIIPLMYFKFPSAYAITEWVLNVVYLWFFLASYRYILTICKAVSWKDIFVILAIIAVLYHGFSQSGRPTFFYPVSENTTEEEGEVKEYLSDEDLANLQDELLQNQLKTIVPPSKKVSDIYFAGFGAYARESVFTRDVSYAAAKFSEIYGDNRSIILNNHYDTYKDLPLASASNLNKTLKALGKKINKEQDAIAIYLTSHGGKDATLSIGADYFSLNDFNSKTLKAALDNNNFKYRIIIISACFSGSFIPDIQDDNSLIITSSAKDRVSYGCSEDSPLTYFGEAYWRAFTETKDFIKAYHQSVEYIVRKEKEEELKHSNPQIYVGKGIEKYLSKNFPSDK